MRQKRYKNDFSAGRVLSWQFCAFKNLTVNFLIHLTGSGDLSISLRCADFDYYKKPKPIQNTR